MKAEIERLSFIIKWRLFTRMDRCIARAFWVILVVKSPPASAGDIRDTGSVPGLERSPGGRHGSPLQYSCLGNPWTEEPVGLQSLRSQRIKHDQRDFACVRWRIAVFALLLLRHKCVRCSSSWSLPFSNSSQCSAVLTVFQLRRNSEKSRAMLTGFTFSFHTLIFAVRCLGLQ